MGKMAEVDLERFLSPKSQALVEGIRAGDKKYLRPINSYLIPKENILKFILNSDLNLKTVLPRINLGAAYFHTSKTLAQLRTEDLAEYVKTVRAIISEEMIGSLSDSRKILKIFFDRDQERRDQDRLEAAILKRFGIKLADFRRDELNLLKSVDKDQYFQRCFLIAEQAVLSADDFIVKFDNLQAQYNKDELRRATALREHGLELLEVRKEFAEHLRVNNPAGLVKLIAGEFSSSYGRQLKDDLFIPRTFRKRSDNFGDSHEVQNVRAGQILRDVLDKYGIEQADFLKTLALITKAS